MVDFAYTETMTEIAGLARAILDDHTTPARLAEVDGFPDRFDPALWKSLRDAGLIEAMLPKRIGGEDLGELELAAAQIELGRALAPVPFLETVVAAGSLESPHQDRILTLATEVSPTASNGTLSGVVELVPYGNIAEAVLLCGPAGAWLLETEHAEVTTQELVDGKTGAKLEFHAAPAQPVELEDRCAPHRRWQLGRCAHQLGVLERALELTAEYARERQQFGRPIGSFQAVTHRLADCYIDVEALRLTLWQAVTSGTETDLATARYTAAEAGHRVAHAAVHVHGGAGLDTDNTLHRYFLAAKRDEFAAGPATESLVELGDLLAR